MAGALGHYAYFSIPIPGTKTEPLAGDCLIATYTSEAGGVHAFVTTFDGEAWDAHAYTDPGFRSVTVSAGKCNVEVFASSIPGITFLHAAYVNAPT